jgi:hypothetical protein
MKVSWRETLSEWFACAGLGMIPLICALAIAMMTDNENMREALIREEFIFRELILFCIVTNAAGIVVFISKFNLLQTAVPQGRKVPTALIFALLLEALACGIVYVSVVVRQRPALPFMLSCLITTLVFSLWAERRIGLLARE